jgi:hypothetical protein
MIIDRRMHGGSRWVGTLPLMGMLGALPLLLACQRGDREGPGRHEVSPQSSSSLAVSSGPAPAPSAPSPPPEAEIRCPSILPETSFSACNPHPRFRSIPDCFEYDLSPSIAVPSACELDLMQLGIAGPQVTDELLVRVTLEAPAGRVSAAYRLTLHRVVGSMMGKFRKPAGSAVAWIVTKRGVPSELVLGPALLPSEIGITRVKAESAD